MKRLNLLKLFISLLVPSLLLAQQTISGVVTDLDGLALPGASIVEKNTTNGVVTDFDGNYSITVKGEQTILIFSFIGYNSQEISVGKKSRINVALIKNVQQLNEVVIIGYGSFDKKDLTGAITSIKPTKEIVEQSYGIEDVIKGRSAGVQVISNGSEPGASTSIKIRGLSSLTANSEPLYVVDGIIMDSATEDISNPLSGYAPPQGGGISGINPSDVESIQILKDASATAIYGSRAANGVIIITTKKGAKGTTKYNFTTSISLGSVVRNIEVLDTEAYANYQNNMRVALGQNLAYTINDDGSIFTTGDDPVEITGINWADDTYRNSVVQKNRLSISGGGDKGNYYLSGGLVSNRGTFPNALAKAFDFNLKVNQELSRRVKISTKVAVTFTELNSSKGTDENGGVNNSMVRQVILAAPIVNFAENNQDADDVDESLDGPRAWTRDYDDDAKEIRLLGSLNIDYKISKAFTYRLRFGGDYRKKDRSFWYGTALLKGKNSNGLAGLGTLNRFRYNIDNTLMFKKSFNKNNRINATIGALYDKTNIKTTRYSAADFEDKSLRADGISLGAISTPVVVDSEFPTIISFIARMNYALYKRYLFTVTLRADGSSKFPKGNQWGYFPAFSFAWKVNEEAFLRNSKTISDLKIRLGYGEVGNQKIPPYSYLSTFMATEAALADASGGDLIAVVPLNLANPDLKWETSIQYNGGIDFGFFNSRLIGTVDAYYKTSSDLLLNVALGPSAGFDFITANQGDIENKGIEFSLNGDIISKEKLRWNVFGNVSFNRNNISDLGDVLPAEFGALGQQTAFTGTQVSGGNFFKQPANIFIKGREAGLFYGLETNGIIRNEGQLTSTSSGNPLKYKGTDMRVGDVFFVDQNGDGDITDADKTIIGNPNPDFTYGFGTTFDYGNLSLSLMFNGTYGNDIANGNLFESGYANNSQKNIRTIAYEDAFNAGSNPDGNYPNVGVGGYGTNYTTEFNDRTVEDGSFLRLSYVTLGYNLPLKGSKFIDSVKLSFSGQNLWLLTDYTGFDPEVNSFAYDPTRTGIDWGNFISNTNSTSKEFSLFL